VFCTLSKEQLPLSAQKYTAGSTGRGVWTTCNNTQGQHILSQAFVTLFNAPTKSFRVLDQSCEIDVDLNKPTDEIIERGVELANNVIWEDRQITIRNVTSEEAASLPLRKDPAREGELRLIQIDDFDLDALWRHTRVSHR
jgi:Ser-tRNA(Ala) deacylase AlaX